MKGFCGSMVFSRILHFDFRSFLLVLAAFIGNAELFGFHVGLLILFGLAIIQFSYTRKFPRHALILIGFLFGVLIAATIRSQHIGVPYYDRYWLWPVQSMIVILIVLTRTRWNWPMGNVIAFAILGCFIFALGEVVDDRFYSIFGPNMLYRIFGFLFIFSLIYYFGATGLARILLLTFSTFGLMVTLLTGSSGGLAIIAVGCSMALWRVSKWLTVTAITLGGFAFHRFSILGGVFDTTYNVPVSFNRLLFKLSNLYVDTRFAAWTEIFSEPPTPFGKDYTSFANLWFSGYLYPHNLFAELYAFYGMIGVVLIVFVVCGGIIAFRKSIEGDILSIAFVVLSIGSLLSGDLSDNYGVIALASGVLLRSVSCRSPAEGDNRLLLRRFG